MRIHANGRLSILTLRYLRHAAGYYQPAYGKWPSANSGDMWMKLICSSLTTGILSLSVKKGQWKW